MNTKNKEELLEQINKYLDFTADYIDNTKIVDYDANNNPIFSYPKWNHKTILSLIEIPFIESVQKSIDTYSGFDGNNLFYKYNYEHLYKEPENKYIYKDYINTIPSNGWEWPYGTEFDDFNQLFVSKQDDYVYNHDMKKKFLDYLDLLNAEIGYIPELYIIKKNLHPYILFSFCLKYPEEILLFYMKAEPMYGSNKHNGKKYV